MPKRIHVQHLSLGMYLHEFCGSWMEHPFWRTRFLLEDPQDLASIRDTQIREVWIDTAKGLDVTAGMHAVSRAEVDAQVDSEFQQLQDEPAGTTPRRMSATREPRFTPPIEVTDATSCGATPAT